MSNLDRMNEMAEQITHTLMQLDAPRDALTVLTAVTYNIYRTLDAYNEYSMTQFASDFSGSLTSFHARRVGH